MNGQQMRFMWVPPLPGGSAVRLPPIRFPRNKERPSFANLPGMHKRIPGSRFRQIAHQPSKYTLSEVLVLAILISISQLSGLDV